jgi:hypothetical protein
MRITPAMQILGSMLANQGTRAREFSLHVQDSNTKTDYQPDPFREAELHFPEVMDGPKVDHEVGYAIDSSSSDKEFLRVDALFLIHWLEDLPDI